MGVDVVSGSSAACVSILGCSALDASAVALGSHGGHHLFINRIPPRLPKEDVERTILAQLKSLHVSRCSVIPQNSLKNKVRCQLSFPVARCSQVLQPRRLAHLWNTCPSLSDRLACAGLTFPFSPSISQCCSPARPCFTTPTIPCSLARNKLPPSAVTSGLWLHHSGRLSVAARPGRHRQRAQQPPADRQQGAGRARVHGRTSRAAGPHRCGARARRVRRRGLL